MIRRPPKFSLFPYPTLFRSERSRSIGRSEFKNGTPRLLRARLASRESPIRLLLLHRKIRTVPAAFFPESRDASRARSSLRSEEHTSELQSLRHLVCRLLLEK